MDMAADRHRLGRHDQRRPVRGVEPDTDPQTLETRVAGQQHRAAVSALAQVDDRFEPRKNGCRRCCRIDGDEISLGDHRDIARADAGRDVGRDRGVSRRRDPERMPIA